MEHTFKLKNGRNFRIMALTSKPFEGGTFYVCEHNLVYNSAHFLSMEATEKFKFGSNTMEEQINTYLPRIFSRYEGEDGHFLVIKKDPNLLPLRDILTHMGQKIPPRHVAWIMSTLFNLCCYLEYTKIDHENLSIDTYYINPPMHSGALLGDWWLAHEKVDKPSEPFDRFTAALSKHSDPSSYSDIIKRIGRELLGDALDVPKALLDFLSAPSADKVRKDYEVWPSILEQSFGPRRFIKLEITKDDLYKS